MKEVWKDIRGYEGIYQVSNLGNVKRLFKDGKERLLLGKKDKDGYIVVILSKHQKKKFYRVHRLVAEAFVPNPENKSQINHKDRKKANNVVDLNDLDGETTNLEWVTSSENVMHCYKTGRKTKKRSILQYTKNKEYISRWNSIKDASKSLRISANNISSCCSGRLQSAGGYLWEYAESGV